MDTKKPRHKWKDVVVDVGPTEIRQLRRDVQSMFPGLPEIPEDYGDVPEQFRKLQRCEHCHWFRIGMRSDRGNQDWFFAPSEVPPGNRKRWSAYTAGHNPRCGEVKDHAPVKL